MKINRKVHKFFYLVFFVSVFFSCTSSRVSQNKLKVRDSLYYFRDFVMGVQVELILRSDSEETSTMAAIEVFDEMKRLDRKLSNWRDDSEISSINRTSPVEWTEVSEELFEVLWKAQELSESTEGAFDVTVGKLLRLWNFYSSKPSIPSDSEQSRAREYVNYRFVELDTDKKMIRFKKPGVEVDLGGIAKGYILRKGYEVLQDYNFRGGLLNGAGDIFAWGTKPDGSLWNIAIRNPSNENVPLAVLPLTDMAVFSSGDYERNITDGGKVLHHIFDPRSGLPATECRGVTVIARSIEEADGLSSSVFILGPERGMDFINKMGNVGVIIITSDGSVLVNNYVKKMFQNIKFSS